MALERIRYEDSSVGDFKEISGIYFLYSGPQIVYVGKSNNIQRRMIEHFGGMFPADYAQARTAHEALRIGIDRRLSTKPSKIASDFDVQEWDMWFSVCKVIDYVEVLYMDKSDIDESEKRYIESYNPPFNIQHNIKYARQKSMRNRFRALSNLVHTEMDYTIDKESELYTYWMLAEITLAIKRWARGSECA